MPMIWSIAWKNVWRNKSRSMVVVVAVILGTVAGVFANGLMIGWVDQRIRSAIHTEMSHIKLRNPEYLKNEEIKYLLPDYEKLTNYLKKSPEVKAFSSQVNVMAWAQTSRGNTGLVVKGIDPEQEKQVSNLYRFVLPDAGTYLDTDARKPIFLSDKTMQELGLKTFEITPEVIASLAKMEEFSQEEVAQIALLQGTFYRTDKAFQKVMTPIIGDGVARFVRLKNIAAKYNLRKKVALNFIDKNGQSVSALFRVCGVFKTTNTMFDQRYAYVRETDITSLAGLLPNEYHEISIILQNDDSEQMEVFKEKLAKQFSNVSVMSWKDLAPDAGMMDDIMVLYYFIIMGIIFIALAFGIVNTMLMAILERIKEIGMLLAVGMSKKRVFGMIMLETIFLTMIGTLVGMFVGWLIVHITGQTGLDFSVVGEGFEAMGWAAKVYPAIDMEFFIVVSMMVMLIAILSSLIPARKALKMHPTEALRADM